MAFVVLILLEWLLLLAAASVFIGGIRGALVAALILSGIVWYTHPDNFWSLEVPFLIGALIGIGVLWYFVKKAGQSSIVAGLAGGIASLVIGTGLIPKIKLKEVAWGVSPMLWRALLGILCIVIGNLMI